MEIDNVVPGALSPVTLLPVSMLEKQLRTWKVQMCQNIVSGGLRVVIWPPHNCCFVKGCVAMSEASCFEQVSLQAVGRKTGAYSTETRTIQKFLRLPLPSFFQSIFTHVKFCLFILFSKLFAYFGFVYNTFV